MFLKKIIKKPVALSALFLSILILFSGCATYGSFIHEFGQEQDENEIVKIGVFQPLSGRDQKASVGEIEGIEIAWELYPTIGEKTVELVYADNQSEIPAAEEAARDLVEKKVVLVLGSYGNTLSIAGGEVFRAARIPAIAITPTNPLVTKSNPFYFRVSVVDSFQGSMAAELAVKELGAHRMVVLRQEQDDYATALSLAFTNEVSRQIESQKEEAAPTWSVLEYGSNPLNVESVLKKIEEIDPEVIFLPSSLEDALAIIGQARQQGIEAIFIGTDLWQNDMILENNETVSDGVLFTAFVDPQNDGNLMRQELLRAYQKRHGEDAVPSEAVAMGFDSYLLARDAIGRHQEELAQNIYVSPQNVLRRTEKFPGCSGTITFDENGDPMKPVLFIAVENGEFIYKYTVEPAGVNYSARKGE